MGKKVNKKALTQAEVKKGYGLDEYFRDTLDSTTFFEPLQSPGRFRYHKLSLQGS